MNTINILAPYQTSFTIRTDCDELLKFLVLEHGQYATSVNCSTDYTITVSKNREIYKISFENQTIKTDIPLRIIKDIMYQERKYDENIFAMHGGAVEYKNGAYLVVASTTSGKTTLTSYLVSNGFGYITDDCILLDRESFKIYPFTTPLHLRKGGYNALKALGCAPENYDFLDSVSIKRYVYTPNNSVSRPLPLKKIFFITRTEDTNMIEEMNTTEKITALLKSPITEYEIGVSYLSFISKLSAIPCKRLYYSNMDFVAEVIKYEQQSYN